MEYLHPHWKDEESFQREMVRQARQADALKLAIGAILFGAFAFVLVAALKWSWTVLFH